MHRIIYFILFALSTINGWAQTSYPLVVSQDILHYEFDLSINDESDRIDGTATLRLVTRQDSIYLDLIGLKNDGKGMKINSLSVNDLIIPYVHNSDRLRIAVPEIHNAKDTLEVKINYNGIPANGLIIAKSKFDKRTFFGDNYPDRARNWLPTVDHPSDKALVTWIITAPSQYKVVANGAFVGEKALSNGLIQTRWEERIPISPKVMVFGAAEFAVEESGRLRDIPVTTWVYAENKEAGFKDFNIAPLVLAYFDSLIGPYPYEKLANVQSKTTYGGMENASNIFYFEESVNGNQERELLIAHEIAHQWFGNSVTESDWPEAWLSEGFATYMTHAYAESRFGKEELKNRMRKDRVSVINYYRKAPLPVVNSNLVSYPNIAGLGELLSNNTYQKGGWFLHMLRQEVGDEVFWKSIKKYYSEYMNSNATTNDLVRIFSDESGVDMSSFFDQWLEGIGQPELSAKWQYKRGEIQLNVDQNQEQDFIFHIEIGIQYEDEVRIEKLYCKDRSNSFSFKGKKPLAILIDPNVKLLYSGEPEATLIE